MIKYTVRVNLAIFVSQSTDANKRTKALKTEKGSIVRYPWGTKKLVLLKENHFA